MTQISVGEISQWWTKALNNNPEKEKNFLFEGKVKKLKYCKTSMQGYAIYSIDEYVDEENKYTFSFNNETGEFVGYSIKSKFIAPNKNSIKISEKEIFDIATKELKNYIDLSGFGYTMGVWCHTENPCNNEKYDSYLIWFYREFDGAKANEGVTITIDDYGVISGFNMINIGLYDNFINPVYDKEAAESELLQKAMDICRVVESNLDEVKIECASYWMSPEKQLSIIYDITFTFKGGDKTDPSTRLIQLAINVESDCYKQ